MVNNVNCPKCGNKYVYRQTDLFENDECSSNRPSIFTFFCKNCKTEFKESDIKTLMIYNTEK